MFKKILLASVAITGWVFASAQQNQPILLSKHAYDSIKATNPAYLRDNLIMISGNNTSANVIQPVIHPSGVSKAAGCNLLQTIVDANGNLTDNTYSVVPFDDGFPPDYTCDDCGTTAIQLPLLFAFLGKISILFTL